ncbi:TRAP transporter small permease [Roseospira visakhapatnamensis]|uniref:TRAP transporter small permease protein n=1 Tax=Roseospira visakhapatnamensis TaxID=390880 RepID=A0A7W6WAL8_9PROT|nr:TRAP transporter small permease [Roseospira visakhapatnamensis]MBB4267320.1 TRAP-type C4-dicarboxylate transport system permease small subunit [Roseospira visakhapatnamensis]
MRRMVIVIDDAVVSIEQALSSVLFLFVFLTLVSSVFFRYVLQSPFTWTEELVTITFSWVIFLGASACLRDHALLRVDAFIHLLPQPLQAVAGAVAVGILLVLLAMLIYYGFTYAIAVRGDLFPMLRLSMAWAALALPVASCLAVLHVLRLVITEGFRRTLMSVTEMGDLAEQS